MKSIPRRRSELSQPSMMCLRLRPFLFGLLPMAPHTLVATTISSRDAISFRYIAGDLLAQARRINIGGVEEIDPGVERDLEMLARIFLVHVPAFGAQRPVRQVAAAVAHASQTNAGHGDSGLAE